MINKKRLLYQLFFIFLLFWIAFALIRTVLNISKIFTEEKSWVGLSDRDKKIKYFGGIHDLILDIKQIKPEMVGFYTGGREFYYGRYELYPIRVMWYTTLKKAKEGIKSNSIEYLVVCCEVKNRLSSAQINELNLVKVAENKEGAIFKHE